MYRFITIIAIVLSVGLVVFRVAFKHETGKPSDVTFAIALVLLAGSICCVACVRVANIMSGTLALKGRTDEAQECDRNGMMMMVLSAVLFCAGCMLAAGSVVFAFLENQ